MALLHQLVGRFATSVGALAIHPFEGPHQVAAGHETDESALLDDEEPPVATLREAAREGEDVVLGSNGLELLRHVVAHEPGGPTLGDRFTQDPDAIVLGDQADESLVRVDHRSRGVALREQQANGLLDVGVGVAFERDNGARLVNRERCRSPVRERRLRVQLRACRLENSLLATRSRTYASPAPGGSRMQLYIDQTGNLAWRNRDDRVLQTPDATITDMQTSSVFVRVRVRMWSGTVAYEASFG